MDEDLISKKELLERYGISYGALYRWKRMGLIPESWFLRRSTPSGQETYFHTKQICLRVERILESKERVSLEELAAEPDSRPPSCRRRSWPGRSRRPPRGGRWFWKQNMARKPIPSMSFYICI